MPSDYRIKLAGFETEVTPDNLTQRFGRHNYYVDCKNDRVGYVVKIRTMKYARQLIKNWHNKMIDGQRIQCQLELNPSSSHHNFRARSPTRSVGGKSERQHSRTRPQNTRSLRSNQDASDLQDVDNVVSTSTINKEADRDRRIFSRAVKDISQSPSTTKLHHATSSDNVFAENDAKCKFYSSKVRKCSHGISFYSRSLTKQCTRE